MIKIEVDEAYAYDVLSILYVKAEKQYDYDAIRKDVYAPFFKMNGYIEEQLNNVHFQVMASKQFANLVAVNKSIFEFLEDIKKREPLREDAIKIDGLNYQRYLCKQELQEKFFPKQKLTEQKIGYDK